MSQFKHECAYCHKEFESKKLRVKCCSNLCRAKLRNKEKAEELKEYHKKYYMERNYDSVRKQQNERYFQEKFGRVRPYKHRKVRPKDWSRIKDQLMPIEKKIFSGDAAFEDIKDFEDTIKNPKSISMIVYNGDGKTIIGYLLAQPLTDTHCHTGMHHRKGIMYLESIGILPEYQGHGLGYRLMNALLLFTAIEKYRGVLLDATSDGMYKLAKKWKFKVVRYNYGHCYGGAKLMWRG